MNLIEYINKINQRYQQGNATEHSYRGELQQLLESIVPEIRATNEPKRQNCGAPDYILTKGEIPIGFVETKNIGDSDLDGIKKTGKKEQFERYKASLNNLIFTDYLNFHIYQDGRFITKITIAELEFSSGGEIKPITENFQQFENLIKDFCQHIGQNIKSSKKLAEMMAGKARLLADVLAKSLASDETHNEDSTLKEQLKGFRQILIHDITAREFADMYAQTIAYGMFAARYHDMTLSTFSRQEAAELIPKSNPFVRQLFNYIAGPDIDDRIKWIVDGLAEIFLACNVHEILKNYGKNTKMDDPIIHFYETFLSEYNPKLRKARGVWYTPEPVVKFIVRTVDDILKSEFHLPKGLADTSKIKKIVKVQNTKQEKEFHQVQILDPATGTGTFLAEVIKHIHKKFVGQQGIWSSYVATNLLPRLNGFELIMASYAMAHLKLDVLLSDTGYKASSQQRFNIYLTNSLEEHHPDTGNLFATWLSNEANHANHIKRDTPVMCIIGNPPYSVSSSNKSPWIEKLTADYKKDLNERNIQPLSDDYIKFIRFGQHFIDKNGSGILAYISNNSFIDGIIHRQMRKNLLESFDKIYILDLHGNSRKKETTSDGSVDQNVFDIMQGVSINIFIKTGKKKKKQLGKVFHYDLQGKRDFKYEFLSENSLNSIEWVDLELKKPNYFFVAKDFKRMKDYDNFIVLKELFISASIGIVTGNDEELVFFKKDELFKKYSCATTYYYRPFDYRQTIFDNKILQRSRFSVMKNYLFPNIGINLVRQSKLIGIDCLITKEITSKHLINGETYNFPLYIYPESKGKELVEQNQERVPNLNLKIVTKIAGILGMSFTNEKATSSTFESGEFKEQEEVKSFSPIDILDFIYAVLHSTKYREKFKEFLKIDFPRVPYPKSKEIFWQLVKLGNKLREIHLFDSLAIEQYITEYLIDGDNIVTKPRFEEIHPLEGCSNRSMFGKVYINDNQFFDKVPLVVWEFYIGGYQPAQKWLKDRKERKLDDDDIFHYQKIIVALAETERLIKEIDKISFL